MSVSTVPANSVQPVGVTQTAGHHGSLPAKTAQRFGDTLVAAQNPAPAVRAQESKTGRATPPLPISRAGAEGLWPGRSAIQEIASGVCITNFFGARKRDQLAQHGITHVLVCADELPTAFPDSYQYIMLKGFTDNTHTDLLKQLDVAIPWIEQAVRRGGRVLLHCAAGRSRSGAVLVAYLMRHKNLTLDEALLLAQSARPIIEPNPGFLEQLKALETR